MTTSAQRVRRSLKAAVAFSAATALSRALAFVLLPIMTRAVTPAEYGELSVTLTIAGVAATALGQGLDVGVVRNYFQLEGQPNERDRYVYSAWQYSLVTSFVGALLFCAIGAPIVAGSDILGPDSLSLAFIGAGLSAVTTTVPFAVLRASQRIRPFLIIGVGNALATSGATVLAVVVLDGGVMGWLAAIIGANALTLALAAVIVPYRRPRPFEWRYTKDALSLGLPMVPHYMSHWGLQVADRLVLATVVSATAVGVYSLAANMAIPAMVILTSVTQGFYPAYSRAGSSAEGRSELGNTVMLQIAIVAVVTLSGALLAPVAVDLLTPPSYAGAAELAAWIVLGYGFLGLYGIPMTLSSLTLGTTKGVWKVTVSATVINIAMVAYLVPEFGLTAAAVASAVGYGLLLIGVTIYAYRRGARVEIPRWRAGGILAACSLLYIATSLIVGSNSIPEATARGLVCSIATAGVALTFPEVRTYLRARLRR